MDSRIPRTCTRLRCRFRKCRIGGSVMQENQLCDLRPWLRQVSQSPSVAQQAVVVTWGAVLMPVTLLPVPCDNPIALPCAFGKGKPVRRYRPEHGRSTRLMLLHGNNSNLGVPDEFNRNDCETVRSLQPWPYRLWPWQTWKRSSEPGQSRASTELSRSCRVTQKPNRSLPDMPLANARSLTQDRDQIGSKRVSVFRAKCV